MSCQNENRFRTFLMDSLTRLEAVYHSKGLLKAIRKFLGIMISSIFDYYVCIKVVWEMDKTIRAFPLRESLLIRQATLEDVPQLKELSEFFNPGKRLRKGHVCFIAYDGNRVVGAMWYSREDYYFYDLHMWLRLDEGEVCGCGTFIIPEYRNKGLFHVLLVNIAKHMQERGYKRRVFLVNEKNAEMRNLIAKTAQARETERITVLKIFWWKFHKRSPM